MVAAAAAETQADVSGQHREDKWHTSLDESRANRRLDHVKRGSSDGFDHLIWEQVTYIASLIIHGKGGLTGQCVAL